MITIVWLASFMILMIDKLIVFWEVKKTEFKETELSSIWRKKIHLNSWKNSILFPDINVCD